jgi:hypothetical protein
MTGRKEEAQRGWAQRRARAAAGTAAREVLATGRRKVTEAIGRQAQKQGDREANNGKEDNGR